MTSASPQTPPSSHPQLVQVLIATRRRPEYLREALESVRAQSAVDRIGTVVVSENGSSRHSQKVCLEFPDLPILYLFQEPELDGLAHARVLSLIDRNPYVAILHDDDWWTPCHLEVALRELDARPECQAYYSTHLQIFGKDPPELHRGAWRIWAAGGEDFRRQVLYLSFVQTIAANMPMFTFHYSSLVARTSALKAATELVAEQGNYFDNDRMTPLFLADPSGLVCSTIPTVMIRRHVEQDSKRAEHRDLGIYKTMAETTRWIQRTWPEQCQQAATLFNSVVDRISENQWREISKDVYDPLLSTVVDELGFKLWRPPVPPMEKFKRLMPVGVRGFLRDCRRRVSFRGR